MHLSKKINLVNYALIKMIFINIIAGANLVKVVPLAKQCSALAFADATTLLVADRFGCVSSLDLSIAFAEIHIVQIQISIDCFLNF